MTIHEPADYYSCDDGAELWMCDDPDEAIQEFFDDLEREDWQKTITVYAADDMDEDDPAFQDSSEDFPIRRKPEKNVTVDFCAWIRANITDLSSEDIAALEKLEATP